ncbi:heparinase II/III family protein [Nonomuraea sp. NPDC059194]|uniref:heparinase II/III domain-containing protein n=1 Tax=Nonomuraea sp. NPDC059194 TaxID=3346764 RepID=UPI0036A4DF99
MSDAYTPHWPAIRRRVETLPWAATIVAALAADFTRWSHDLVIPGPEQPSAWTHHYFCDADGAALVFDAAAPDRHACSACDRVYVGEPWDGAWRTKMHNAAAIQAQRAALLIRLSGARLSRAGLSEVGLSEVGPFGAELSGTGLSGAGLSGAGPSGVRLLGGAEPGAGLLGAEPGAGLLGGVEPGAGLLGGVEPGAGLLGGVEPGAELERIAAAYAHGYLSYQPHGVNAGQGRVLPQSLDEAVWAVGLLRALRWAGDVLSPSTSTAVDAMARAIAELLRPQVGMVHNIHCWLLAALAECAARLGDRELMTWCRDSPFGAQAQVLDGFHPEGLWYEVNAHYHYYAVAALLSYREAAGPDGLSKRAALRLSRAIAAPPSLAYADTRLPAYGDGWAECHVGDFAPQAEAAYAILPEAPVDLAPYYETPSHEASSRETPSHEAPSCEASSRETPSHEAPSHEASSCERPLRGPVRPWFGDPATVPGCVEIQGRCSSVAALLFGPDDVPARSGSRASFVWPHAGIGVLRSPAVRLAMRFGPDGGWHDHRDKLNVDVETVTGWTSLDLGTSGYGSEFTAWMRSPYAHNLVIVDGARQPAHTGRLLESSARHLVAESAWEGNVLRRSVEVTGHGWSDEFAVTLATAGRIEWVFHGDGPFAAITTTDQPDAPVPVDALPRPLRDVRPDPEEEGSPDMPPELGETTWRDVRPVAVPPDRVLRGTWDVDGAPRLALAVPEGFEAYAATAPGNPNGRPLGVLLLRGHGDHARFHATFDVSRERSR